jgi:glycyl-tRNA synthetase
MHLHPSIAPYKAAVLPLSKQLSPNAEELLAKLSKEFSVTFDETASIGKRYRRQDAIGTPFCITYDFDSLNDNCVTVRERDSMQQVRLPIDEVANYINEKIKF